MIKTAIVEDEDSYADILTEYMHRFEREYGEQFSIRRYQDGYEIVDPYPGDLDIIFMDIEMGLMNGMEAAEKIRRKDEYVEMIFVTNLAQYAIQGYRVRALDYILKPIEYIPFAESLKRVLRSLRQKEEAYLTIHLSGGVEKLLIPQILWIESSGHRLTFHLADRTVESTVYSMKEMETELAESGFARCNSGCLVNLRQVTGFGEGTISVQGTKLAISRGKKADFMSALLRYMNM